MVIALVFFAVISLTTIAFMIFQSKMYSRDMDELAKIMEQEFEEEKKKIRKEAIENSKRVTRGQIAEEMLPLFPEFPYNMSDCKFSGSPLDYIVFCGMSDLRSEKEGEINIIFADVKTRKAKLGTIQKKIKEAVEKGRVRFEQWTVDENNKIVIK